MLCHALVDRPDKVPRIFSGVPRPLWGYNSNGERGTLAPLAYLEKIAPLRRHPMDERALMSFSGPYTSDYTSDLYRRVW